MTCRAWLIQFLEQGVVDEYLDPTDVVWPAVSRFQADIAAGDRVVLWAAGAGDTAGVFAVGVVDGAVEEVDHAADYRDPGGKRRMRPSMPVRYTHFFDERRISRAELKADPVFDGFSLFRRANQQNPFPLTDEQWDVVWSRVPSWSDLSTPKLSFVVALELGTNQSDRQSAARELEQCFADRSWGRFVHEVSMVGVDTTECDAGPSRPESDVPTGANFVVRWERQVDATSWPDALRRVYAELYADPDQFMAGEYTLLAVSDCDITRRPA